MTIKTKITPLGAGNKVFYTVGQILFESGVPGTYPLEVLTKVLCDIWISGGGGGGSNGAGGTGATLHIQGILLPGSYVLVVGNFGDGAGAYVRNNNGKPGGVSSITGPSCKITANGGLGRNGRRNGGGGGTVGALSYQLAQTINILFQSQEGVSYALSYIDNTSSGYGAGGIAQGNDEGAGYPGKTGYIKITFIK